MGEASLLIQLNDYNYILLINKGLTKGEFLKKVKVKKNTFAGNLMERVYENLINEASDLLYEYERFYSREYESLEEFLYKKLLIDKDTIKLLLDNFSEEHYLYMGDLTASGNYNLAQFILSDDFKEALNKVL